MRKQWTFTRSEEKERDDPTGLRELKSDKIRNTTMIRQQTIRNNIRRKTEGLVGNYFLSCIVEMEINKFYTSKLD